MAFSNKDWRVLWGGLNFSSHSASVLSGLIIQFLGLEIKMQKELFRDSELYPKERKFKDRTEQLEISQYGVCSHYWEMLNFIIQFQERTRGM